MSIDDIKKSELTDSEREVLEGDRERWKHMGSGGHLDQWLAYGPGQAIRRHLAMKLAYTNRPEGKAYNAAFGQLLRDDGFDTNDKKLMSYLTNVAWLHDDPERLTILREIRQSMTPGERSRLNTPIAARQRVTAELKARAGGGEAKQKHSPITIYKQQLAEAARKIAHLEEQLAASEAGSLFDIKRDSAEDIGQVMAAHMSEGRFDTAVKAAKAVYKRKQKPAG
jgi:hypothetical protein